jgi:hypothetical protein
MSQRRIFRPGLLFTLLAILAQLASGTAVQRTETLASLANATTICHSDETSDQAPVAPRHPADCPICPLCVPLSAPGIALTVQVALPAPRVMVIARSVVLPPATAPPAIVVSAARPRGPPTILT